uniref:Translation initiation factor IF-2, chloroplastic n=1 Tax=Galaxaura rugosa TaxID=268570 RepID=A0A1G4NSV3_9FLOR|nr:Translation initiation factor 2 [Galaxaura rugosa]SCW21762.1 Translation initiation factor 2 [Galaxaura rugosa]
MCDCLRLENPKVIYIQNNQVKLPQTVTNVSSLNNMKVIVEEVANVISIRSEKKNKNYPKTIDLLDSKKNKVKNRKKLRAQISINEEDELVTQYSQLSAQDSNLPLSQVRGSKKHIFKQNSNLKQKLKNLENSNAIISDATNEKIQKPNKILVDSPVSIQELAEMLLIPPAEIIKSLFLQGISITMNDVIDIEMIKSVAETYGVEVILGKASIMTSYKQKIVNNNPNEQNLQNRDPIISIFGHVDHGKTTLLETIRKTKKAQVESGGITQAIVAYKVPVKFDSFTNIICLDTPGHEAFSDMRIRGVQVTDIAILVVAADDGLQSQTIESINHLKKNLVPFIVTINKIDSKGANISKIRSELASLDIVDQEYGGTIPIIEISALLKLNIEKLLKAIEVMALKLNLIADYTAPGSGTVLDAFLDKQQGPIANLLVQNGQVRVGDYIKIDNMISKIRSIADPIDNKLTIGEPSSIIRISGLDAIPIAGKVFYIINNQKEAKRQYIEKHKNKDKNLRNYKKLNTNIIFETSGLSNRKTAEKIINIILKTDSDGTINAILNTFNSIPQQKIQLNIVSAGVGEITINDVDLAIISKSVIVGFNNIIGTSSQQMAVKNNIIIKNFSVIYDLVDYIKQVMLDLVDIEYNENIIGYAIVKDVFSLSKGSVAGCYVNQGKLKRKSYIRVKRNQELIYNGQLTSLKRIKENVEEVNVNNECGVLCNDFNLWEKEDIIEAYELVPMEKTLEIFSPKK